MNLVTNLAVFKLNIIESFSAIVLYMLYKELSSSYDYCFQSFRKSI